MNGDNSVRQQKKALGLKKNYNEIKIINQIIISMNAYFLEIDNLFVEKI